MGTSPSRFARVVRLGARLALLGVAALAAAGGVAYWRSGNDCPGPGRTPPVRPMKAFIRCAYGPPDALRLETLAQPVPSDSQLLVRVRAVSVNPADWHAMNGTPMFARLSLGLRKPSTVEMGTDFAGTVESVGRSVTRFKPGDAVFGVRSGAFAEYVTIRESRVVPVPPNLTFEQAAAVPVAAITALQGLRDQGKVRAGQRVLVNGASGGVGTFAVQLAKSLGAEVTGVCSARNVELVRSIGADHVIDYTKETFTERPERYDVILDNVGNHPLPALRRTLVPGGTYVMIGGPKGKWLDPLPRVAATVVRSWFGREEMRFFIAQVTTPDLMFLHDLMVAGRLTPVIDRTYPFAKLPDAMRYLETGRARGKVVVTVE